MLLQQAELYGALELEVSPPLAALLAGAGLPAAAAAHERMRVLRAILAGAAEEAGAAVRLCRQRLSVQLPGSDGGEEQERVDVPQLQQSLLGLLKEGGLAMDEQQAAEVAEELSDAAEMCEEAFTAYQDDPQLGLLQLLELKAAKAGRGTKGAYHVLRPQCVPQPAPRCMAWAARRGGHKEPGLCSSKHPRYRLELAHMPGYFFVCGHHHHIFDECGPRRKLYRVNDKPRKVKGDSWQVKEDSLANGAPVVLWGQDELTPDVC